jgi:hypothetical protein
VLSRANEGSDRAKRLINLNHRTTAWIASYADILFAVNRRYHPGEKRLLTYMADLPSRPEDALEFFGDYSVQSGIVG